MPINSLSTIGSVMTHVFIVLVQLKLYSLHLPVPRYGTVCSARGGYPERRTCTARVARLWYGVGRRSANVRRHCAGRQYRERRWPGSGRGGEPCRADAGPRGCCDSVVSHVGGVPHLDIQQKTYFRTFQGSWAFGEVRDGAEGGTVDNKTKELCVWRKLPNLLDFGSSGLSMVGYPIPPPTHHLGEQQKPHFWTFPIEPGLGYQGKILDPKNKKDRALQRLGPDFKTYQTRDGI